jgi:hypothetical protein
MTVTVSLTGILEHSNPAKLKGNAAHHTPLQTSHRNNTDYPERPCIGCWYQFPKDTTFALAKTPQTKKPTFT